MLHTRQDFFFRDLVFPALKAGTDNKSDHTSQESIGLNMEYPLVAFF